MNTFFLGGDERKLQIQELTKVTSVSFTLENRGSSFKLSEIQWTPNQIVKVFMMFGLYASMCNEWCNCSAGDHLMHILIKSVVSILVLKKPGKQFAIQGKQGGFDQGWYVATLKKFWSSGQCTK